MLSGDVLLKTNKAQEDINKVNPLLLQYFFVQIYHKSPPQKTNETIKKNAYWKHQRHFTITGK